MTESSNKFERRSDVHDQDWFDRYQQIPDFHIYLALNAPAAEQREQKQQFESGATRNPTLHYPKLYDLQFDQIEESLLRLKDDILSAEPVQQDPIQFEVLKMVYRWKINEKVAELRLLKAARDHDTRRFERYDALLYGKPSQEIFDFTIDQVQKDALQSREVGGPDLQQAAHEVSMLVAYQPTSVHEFILPSEETYQTVVKHTLNDKELTAMYSVEVPDVENASIEYAFAEAIKSLKLPDEWQVVSDENIQTLNVDHAGKKINFKPGYIKTVEECKAIILHEIGTHVLRRRNGERSRLLLLSVGLDRYLKGEEGVATMREQAFKGQALTDFEAYDRFLALGFAKGLDGKPRDFRDTYEMIIPILRFRLLVGDPGKTYEQATEEAQGEAWSLCVRIFRGGDMSKPGNCSRGISVYREGNIETWDLINKDASVMQRFSLGKFDAANPRHLWVLSELGIGDNDLTEIAN